MSKLPSPGQEQVLQSLIGVFRDFGFEGASLTRFTERSGLIKASLYHRFPEGKEQMALAALTEVDRIFASHVLAPIDFALPASERLALVSDRLDAFYEGGTRSCLLETLSGAGTPSSVRRHVQRSLEFWTAKFAHLSKSAGVRGREARVRAEGAIAAIEGALIVARAQGSNKEFRRCLESLSDQLLVP